MGQYRYTGEAETLLPSTLDGTRVVSEGDVVRVLDGALDGHPLFEPVEGAPSDVPDPQDDPEPDGAVDDEPDADDGEPQEPTA